MSEREQALAMELGRLIQAAEAYMRYHEQKYLDSGLDVSALSGLWPAINNAEAVLAKAEGREPKAPTLRGMFRPR